VTDPEPEKSSVPTDRLTRLCAAMTDALDAHPEYREGDRCVVLLSSTADAMRGLVIHGYERDKDAVVDLVEHLRAMFKANGMELHLVSVGRTPEDRRH
jgi:hypothetical protein